MGHDPKIFIKLIPFNIWKFGLDYDGECPHLVIKSELNKNLQIAAMIL